MHAAASSQRAKDLARSPDSRSSLSGPTLRQGGPRGVNTRSSGAVLTGGPRAQSPAATTASKQAPAGPPMVASLNATAGATAVARVRLSLPSSLASPTASAGRSPQTQPGAAKRAASTTREEIKRIDANREQRRRAAEELKRSRQEEAALLSEQCGGVVPDIDFHRMIRDFQAQCAEASSMDPLDPSSSDCAMVCVRKRPLQQQEAASRELDCVTARNPTAVIHERKFKVDGITKCLESHRFEFDRVFHEESTTEDVFRVVAEPLVPWAIRSGGRATLFAYGQTGSGKTYTMTGIQSQLADQIFQEVSVSFFEIYGGRPYDLLNNRQRLETLEDAKSEVQVSGLVERPVESPEAMLQCIELGNSLRTTHATSCNADSSRSHAICAVFLRSVAAGAVHAKMSLVDLAGSERASDCKSSIRQRRVEGAEINKSLLALKECIRAMGDRRDSHVPFRASKLTMVLRDAFVSRCPSRTVMIACISPCMTSADHSINTLRYSDRLKDRKRDQRPASERDFQDSGCAGSAGVTTSRPVASSCEPGRHSRKSGAGLQVVRPAAQDQTASSNCAAAAASKGVERELPAEEPLSIPAAGLPTAPLVAWEETEGSERAVASGAPAAAADPRPGARCPREPDAVEEADREATGGASRALDPTAQTFAELAHLEALDEVQQWEDRIVSQHMVALQEDARLLTMESELLSQVQQGPPHDIDKYVCDVEGIVQRKMEVYAALLKDLEAFKLQLRREEALSRSCQPKGCAESPLGGQESRPDPSARLGACAGGATQVEIAGGPAAASRSRRYVPAVVEQQDSEWTPRTPRVRASAALPASSAALSSKTHL